MQFNLAEKIIIALAIIAVLITGAFLVLHKNTVPVVIKSDTASANSIAPVIPPPQKLSNPPEIVKAVFATGYSAGSKGYLNYLSNLFSTTEINAVVVDIKGSDGIVSYPGRIKDIDELVRFFHDKNIYVIGRIAVFEDPVYSKARPELAIYDTSKLTSPEPGRRVLWRDNNGLSWLDPASKDVWNYNISYSKTQPFCFVSTLNYLSSI